MPRAPRATPITVRQQIRFATHRKSGKILGMKNSPATLAKPNELPKARPGHQSEA
jgi:hypothetical protein